MIDAVVFQNLEAREQIKESNQRDTVEGAPRNNGMVRGTLEQIFFIERAGVTGENYLCPLTAGFTLRKVVLSSGLRKVGRGIPVMHGCGFGVFSMDPWVFRVHAVPGRRSGTKGWQLRLHFTKLFPYTSSKL